jgi:hypothetical protein
MITVGIRELKGKARLGAPNAPELYPRMTPPLPSGSRLLDAEREER